MFIPLAFRARYPRVPKCPRAYYRRHSKAEAKILKPQGQLRVRTTGTPIKEISNMFWIYEIDYPSSVARLRCSEAQGTDTTRHILLLVIIMCYSNSFVLV